MTDTMQILQDAYDGAYARVLEIGKEIDATEDLATIGALRAERRALLALLPKPEPYAERLARLQAQRAEIEARAEEVPKSLLDEIVLVVICMFVDSEDN